MVMVMVKPLTPTVEVPEIPRAVNVRLPASSSALVVVDMQNDFAHPEGVLFCPDAPKTVPLILGLLEQARSVGARVVFTQDWHTDEDPEFRLWGEHAKAGTWGAEVVAPLRPLSGETTIHKLGYDPFYGTSLDHLLRSWRVEHLVITGTVANICVLHAAGAAAIRGYQVVLPEDAVSALNTFDMLSTLRQVSFTYGGKVGTAKGIVFV